MADNYLITGYWGEPHVTAENDRGIHAAMFGTGRFVLPVGEQFRAEYIGNNTIRMYDGKLMDNGAAAGIPAGGYVDLLISNAGQGKKRNDLIVFQYEQEFPTLIEKGTFVVIRGEETSGTPSDPELTQEDLLSNRAGFDQMALWRVSVSGTTISAPVKVFSVSAGLDQKAPSGYGLGSQSCYTIADLNDLTLANGWYNVSTTTANKPYDVTYALLTVSSYFDTKIYTLTEITKGTVVRRISRSGNIGEWEYENPRMTLGVEYRTTERWEGAPVYTVLLDCGNTVTNDKTQIKTDIVCGAIIRIAGRIGGYTTPYIYEVLDSRYSAWVTAHNQNGYLQVNTYASDDTGNMPVKVQVWYTK